MLPPTYYSDMCWTLFVMILFFCARKWVPFWLFVGFDSELFSYIDLVRTFSFLGKLEWNSINCLTNNLVNANICYRTGKNSACSIWVDRSRIASTCVLNAFVNSKVPCWIFFFLGHYFLFLYNFCLHLFAKLSLWSIFCICLELSLCLVW